MGKQARPFCSHCDARLTAGDSFCGVCGNPTIWATHDERVAWEVARWREMNGNKRQEVHTPVLSTHAFRDRDHVSVAVGDPPAARAEPAPARRPEPAPTAAAAAYVEAPQVQVEATAPVLHAVHAPEDSVPSSARELVESASSKELLERIVELLAEMNERIEAVERAVADDTPTVSSRIAAWVRRNFVLD